MGLNLSDNLKSLLAQNSIELNLVLEVVGLPYLFGVAGAGEFILLGETDPATGNVKYELGDPIFLGQKISSGDPHKYISLARTTKTVSQQLKQSQGASSSIQRFNVELVDVADNVSSLFAPNGYVDDVLGTLANIYVIPEGTIFPDDSIKILNGVIDTFTTTPTSIVIGVAASENLKRAELFQPVEGVLLSDTIVEDDTNAGITISSDTIFPDRNPFTPINEKSFNTYCRINDEIFKYTGIETQPSGNYILTQVKRAQFGTIEATHEVNDTVESAVRLQGNPLDLALKLMISGTPDALSYATLEALSASGDRINFGNNNYDLLSGLSVGDTVIVSYPSQPAISTTVTFVGKDTQNFITTEYNTFPVYSGGFDVLVNSPYNVLPEGANILPNNIDIARFQSIREFVPTNIPDLDFYLTDSIRLREFISDQLFAPFGFYSLDRKARISVGYTSPPYATNDTKTLDPSTIENAASLALVRTTNKNYYNGVKYLYNYDEFDGDAKAKQLNVSGNTRIKKSLTTLEFAAEGLKKTIPNDQYIKQQSDRLLNRYELAPIQFKATTSYQFGIDVELGDAIIFDYDTCEAFNYESGVRGGGKAVVEVVNKSYNWAGGNVTFECLDTGFGSELRYAGISQSSKVSSGSTLRYIQLKPSFGNKSLVSELQKWTDKVGQFVTVYKPDFSFQQNCKIINIDLVAGLLEVNGLVSIPSPNDIVELSQYDESSTDDRVVTVFMNTRDDILNIPNDFEIEVADGSIYIINSSIRLYNADFTSLIEARVESITGNIITLKDDSQNWSSDYIHTDQLGFTIDNGKTYSYL